MQVKGGTQCVDGYWAYLRQKIGRKSVNTGVSEEDPKRAQLHQLVRVQQWEYWHLNEDKFKLVQKIFQKNQENFVAELAADSFF